MAALDESFFRVRFDRLTPLEKKYLRAMAELGPGPHRSGDVAEVLDRGVTSLGPTRNQLIAKGMIWSPSHGDTAFTVRQRLEQIRGRQEAWWNSLSPIHSPAAWRGSRVRSRRRSRRRLRPTDQSCQSR
ncbi:MAG: hypothetical protein AB7F74_04245 [Parvibaculaceae bacterium]